MAISSSSIFTEMGKLSIVISYRSEYRSTDSDANQYKYEIMPIAIFEIPQVISVVLPESTGLGEYVLSNYPVNRTDFRLVRGVQNEIQFFVRDIDRIPVPYDPNQIITINIVDKFTNTLVMQRNLVVQDYNKALYKLTIFPSETLDWVDSLNWSMTLTRQDGSVVMLWTDQNYGPTSTLQVSDGPTPGPAPVITMDPSTFISREGILYSSNLEGAFLKGYTNGMQTFTMTTTNFTGTIRVDASLEKLPYDDLDWFEVLTDDYVNANGTVVKNAQGNYLWMRVVIWSPAGDGSVDQIVYKS